MLVPRLHSLQATTRFILRLAEVLLVESLGDVAHYCDLLQLGGAFDLVQNKFQEECLRE